MIGYNLRDILGAALGNNTISEMSVGDKVVWPINSLSVSPSSISEAAGATVVTLTVQSTGDWNCSKRASSDAWFTLSRNSGGAGTTTVTVTIDANISSDARSSYIRFVAAGTSNELFVPVAQQGQSAYVPISLYDSYLLATAEYGSATATLPVSAFTFSSITDDGDAQSLTIQAYVNGNGVSSLNVPIQLAVFDLGSGMPSSWDDISRYSVTSQSLDSNGHFNFYEIEMPGNTFGDVNIAISIRIQVGDALYYAKLSDNSLDFQTSFCFSLI